MDANVNAAFRTMQAGARVLKPQGGGRIFVTTSVSIAGAHITVDGGFSLGTAD